MSSRLKVITASLLALVLVAVGIGLALAGSSDGPSKASPAASSTTPASTSTVANSRHPACIQAVPAIQDLITTIQSFATATPADLVSELTKERTAIAVAAAKNINDPAAESVARIARAITAILELQRTNPEGDFTSVVNEVTAALQASTKACTA